MEMILDLKLNDSQWPELVGSRFTVASSCASCSALSDQENDNFCSTTLCTCRRRADRAGLWRGDTLHPALPAAFWRHGDISTTSA